MMSIKEIEQDEAAVNGSFVRLVKILVPENSRQLYLIDHVAALNREIADLKCAELRRSEFICKKCGIRQNAGDCDESF